MAETADETADGIRVRGRLSGSLADGSPIRVETDTVFTAADGRVVGVWSAMRPSAAENWGKELAAGSAEDSTSVGRRRGGD